MSGTRPLLVVGFRWSLLLALVGVSLAREGHGAPAQDPAPSNAADSHATAQRLLFDWAAKQQSSLSVTVAQLPTETTLFVRDGDTPRNPASVSKLVTALVALRTLGPSHQFKTTLHGRVVNGHAERLVIRGEGDPSFSSDAIQGMAQRLVAMGLSHVDSAIVVDQSYFDDQFVPPAFEQQPSEWASFRSPVCATSVDGNRLSLRVIPSAVGVNARVFVEPFGAVELTGRVPTVERDTKGSRIQFEIVPRSERPLVRVGGEIGASEQAVLIQKRTGDPRMTVGFVLRDALRTRGVSVTSGVKLGTVDGQPSIMTHSSDALSVLLYRLGKDSDNFAAEMLLKSVGARAAGTGSSDAGAKVVLEYLAALGARDSDLRWINGSGLFDANRVSTNLLVRVLATAYRDRRIAPEYFAQLALGGTDGTMASRLRTLPSGCFVRAKTGTLRTTISLAGYVERPDNRALGFAIIAEDVRNQAAARLEIDRYVKSLCEPFGDSLAGN